MIMEENVRATEQSVDSEGIPDRIMGQGLKSLIGMVRGWKRVGRIYTTGYSVVIRRSKRQAGIVWQHSGNALSVEIFPLPIPYSAVQSWKDANFKVDIPEKLVSTEGGPIPSGTSQTVAEGGKTTSEVSSETGSKSKTNQSGGPKAT